MKNGVHFYLNREFSTEEIQMAKKLINKWPTSLALRKMQFKIIPRFHLTLFRTAKIKKQQQQKKIINDSFC